MDSALRMRKERTFEVYSQWSSTVTPDLAAAADLEGQSLQRAHRFLSWRGDSSREICSDAASRKICPDCVECLRLCLHHVVSGTAMNVDIDVGWNERGFRKAMGCRDWIVATCRKTLDTTDAAVL